MNLLRIDHVSLDVRDRARSLAFYDAVLGLSAGHVSGIAADQPMFVGTGTSRLGLFAGSRPRFRHVALATDPDGQRRVAGRLLRLGVACRHEQHGDHSSLYFRDPDDFVVEVMVTGA